MSISTKKTAVKAAKKAAKPAKKWFPDKMGKSEIQPLAIAAKEAFDFQASMGNIDRGVKFDDWRREQVEAKVQRNGLSDCKHEHFRPLMAHFKLLAGKDDAAFALEMRTGKVTTSGAPDDTREAREKIAREIHIAMREHIVLADTPWPLYLDQWERSVRASWEAEHLDGPWPGLAAKAVNQVMARKIAIEDNSGPLREGYMLAVLRQKTRRPDLTLGPDLASGLAERCTIKQLRDLLSTMVNRIAAREGRGATANRNKAQKTPRAKAARSTKTLAPRFP